MGNWGSTNNGSTNNGSKKSKYGIFSTIPNFRQILRKNAEIFMDPYKIDNEDLDENNFAKLFIYRIVNDINLEKKLKPEEKILKLDAFLYCLLLIYQKNSKHKKNTVKDIKEAYEIIDNNYSNYRIQIQEEMEKLKKNVNSGSNSGSNLGSKSGSNLGTNLGSKSGSNLGTNSVSKSGSNLGSNLGSKSVSNSGSNQSSKSGGSRKKSKKSRS